MTTGLLIFDDDKTHNLQNKVERATQHYWNKHGHIPNTCIINPATDPENNKTVVVTINSNGYKMHMLTISQSRRILVNHFWLGQADKVVKA